MLAPIVMFVFFLKGNTIRTLIPGISALPQSACAHPSNLLHWSWGSLPTWDQKRLFSATDTFAPSQPVERLGHLLRGGLWVHGPFQVLFLFRVWGSADGVGWEVLVYLPLRPWHCHRHPVIWFSQEWRLHIPPNPSPQCVWI